MAHGGIRNKQALFGFGVHRIDIWFADTKQVSSVVARKGKQQTYYSSQKGSSQSIFSPRVLATTIFLSSMVQFLLCDMKWGFVGRSMSTTVSWSTFSNNESHTSCNMIIEWHPVIDWTKVKNCTSNNQALEECRNPRSMWMISECGHGGGAMPRSLFPNPDSKKSVQWGSDRSASVVCGHNWDEIGRKRSNDNVWLLKTRDGWSVVGEQHSTINTRIQWVLYS